MITFFIISVKLTICILRNKQIDSKCPERTHLIFRTYQKISSNIRYKFFTLSIKEFLYWHVTSIFSFPLSSRECNNDSVAITNSSLKLSQPYITTLFRIRGQKPYIDNLVPFIHLFRRKRTCKMNFRQYRVTIFSDKIPITGRTNHCQTAHRINFHNFFESDWFYFLYRLINAIWDFSWISFIYPNLPFNNFILLPSRSFLFPSPIHD